MLRYSVAAGAAVCGENALLGELARCGAWGARFCDGPRSSQEDVWHALECPIAIWVLTACVGRVPEPVLSPCNWTLSEPPVQHGSPLPCIGIDTGPEAPSNAFAGLRP